MTTLGTAVLKIDTDESGVDKGFSSVQKKAEGLGSTMSTALGTATGFVAAKAGMMAMDQGFDLLIGNAANFEGALGGVQAATGATSDEMDKMRGLALKIGADTSKSASDAVLAMGELAKAGMPVQEILDGAAMAAVRMAEATGISVPAAAILVSNALNTFQADGLSAAGAAEIFSRAANASAIDVNDLGMSLSAVGPVAAASGVSMQEFATMMGLFGNNAMRGSDAGTSFKAFLAGLSPATDKATAAMKAMNFTAFDAQGNFKDMRTIVKELGDSMGGMTEQQRATTGELLFGSDGVRGLNIMLKEGVDGWDSFNGSMAKAPSLAEQSAMRMKGLNGSIEILKGSIETVSIVFGTFFLGILAQAVGKVTELVNAIIPLVTAFMGLEPVQAVLQGLGDVLAFVGSHQEILAGIATALLVLAGPVIVAGIVAITVAMWGFVAATIASSAALLLSPIGLIAIALGLLVVAILYAIKHWDQIKETMLSVSSAITGAVSAAWDKIKSVVSSVGQAVVDFVTAHWKTILLVITGPIGAIILAVIHNWDLIKDTIMKAEEAVVGFVTDHWQTILAVVLGPLGILIGQVIEHFGQIRSTVEEATNAVLRVIESVWGTIRDTVSSVAREIYQVISSVFADASLEAERSFNYLRDRVVGAIQSALDWMRPIVDQIMSLVSKVLDAAEKVKNVAGSVVGAAGDVMGFASGGRPPVGVPSIVGENGWELFVPDTAGTILNHRESMAAVQPSSPAGGMPVMVNFNGPTKILAQDEDQARRSASNLGYAATQAILSRGLAVVG